MEVKGCSKRNRWHFCEDIGTVWNGVRPALRCLEIACLCMLSFLLNDFSQTEQNQLKSAPQEQNVDWEKCRMLRVYIGFASHEITFLLLSSSTTTTTTTTTIFLFLSYYLFFFFVVVFIIICQGSLLGFLLYSWANLYANVGLLTRIINWLTARENDKTISSPSAES